MRTPVPSLKDIGKKFQKETIGWGTEYGVIAGFRPTGFADAEHFVVDTTGRTHLISDVQIEDADDKIREHVRDQVCSMRTKLEVELGKEPHTHG